MIFKQEEDTTDCTIHTYIHIQDQSDHTLHHPWVASSMSCISSAESSWLSFNTPDHYGFSLIHSILLRPVIFFDTPSITSLYFPISDFNLPQSIPFEPLISILMFAPHSTLTVSLLLSLSHSTKTYITQNSHCPPDSSFSTPSSLLLPPSVLLIGSPAKVPLWQAGADWGTRYN